MHTWTRWVFGLFLSPIGVAVLAALDSTLFFSLPFGIDAAIVIVSARRVIRFGAEAALAVLYGRSIIRWLDSDLFHDVVAFFIIAAIALSVVSVVRVVRATRPARRRRAA